MFSQVFRKAAVMKMRSIVLMLPLLVVTDLTVAWDRWWPREKLRYHYWCHRGKLVCL